MRQIKERAVIERAKRYFLKKDLILHKHKVGNRDYLMNGNLYAYTSTLNNVLDDNWDKTDFIAMAHEVGILKDDEEMI